MIKFGTDGWRAIISEEFTFANVEKVARAIALHLINKGQTKQPVIIGYDARFLADKFAARVAKVLTGAGINCFITERDTPTPVVAWDVRRNKAAGAVMLTASHNPAEYCGIKFIPDFGGPAGEEITQELQENSNKELSLPPAEKKGTLEHYEPRDRYLENLKKLVDVELIKKAKLKIVYDPMHGSGRGYTDKLLQELGCQVEVINGNRDVLFGGRNPEPADENLADLKAKMNEIKADLGLANDGDADRFGVVDEKGNFLGANQIIPLLAEYLISERKFTGSIVRSVATSNYVDRVAAAHQIKLYETPVGFKHIAKLMLQEAVIIGGEESGGLSIKGHIPEKDGMLACLLVVEMLARRQKKLSQLWQELISKYGEVFTFRTGLHLAEEKKQALMKKLKEEEIESLAGIAVTGKSLLDGVKLSLADKSWVLVRPSGTEPLVRVYAEADDRAKLDKIVAAVYNLTGGK